MTSSKPKKYFDKLNGTTTAHRAPYFVNRGFINESWSSTADVGISEHEHVPRSTSFFIVDNTPPILNFIDSPWVSTWEPMPAYGERRPPGHAPYGPVRGSSMPPSHSGAYVVSPAYSIPPTNVRPGIHPPDRTRSLSQLGDESVTQPHHVYQLQQPKRMQRSNSVGSKAMGSTIAAPPTSDPNLEESYGATPYQIQKAAEYNSQESKRLLKHLKRDAAGQGGRKMSRSEMQELTTRAFAHASEAKRLARKADMMVTEAKVKGAKGTEKGEEQRQIENFYDGDSALVQSKLTGAVYTRCQDTVRTMPERKCEISKGDCVDSDDFGVLGNFCGLYGTSVNPQTLCANVASAAIPTVTPAISRRVRDDTRINNLRLAAMGPIVCGTYCGDSDVEEENSITANTKEPQPHDVRAPLSLSVDATVSQLVENTNVSPPIENVEVCRPTRPVITNMSTIKLDQEWKQKYGTPGGTDNDEGSDRSYVGGTQSKAKKSTIGRIIKVASKVEKGMKEFYKMNEYNLSPKEHNFPSRQLQNASQESSYHIEESGMNLTNVETDPDPYKLTPSEAYVVSGSISHTKTPSGGYVDKSDSDPSRRWSSEGFMQAMPPESQRMEPAYPQDRSEFTQTYVPPPQNMSRSQPRSAAIRHDPKDGKASSKNLQKSKKAKDVDQLLARMMSEDSESQQSSMQSSKFRLGGPLQN